MSGGIGIKRTLKQPGSYRILLGGILVFLLALATVIGQVWTDWDHEEMDLENQLAPPEADWLKRLLTTEEGLRIHERNKSGSKGSQSDPPREGGGGAEDGDDLDFLAPSAPAEDGSQGPSTPAGNPVEAPAMGEIKRSHYLGTDKNGRDMLALLVAGARTCFLPGLVTCSVALGLGIPFGLLAGFYGGRFRQGVHMLNGTVLSLPRLVLILVVICALEPNVYYTMGVLGVTMIPRVSELIATRVRILSNMGFILAAKEAALSDFKILYRHLFWYQNRAVFFIQFSLIMAESILVETTLSYLQFGTKPPEVSWGNIIEGSQMSFFSGFYWITFFPAAAIILAILGFFYLGDGLNARLAFREGR